MAAMTNRAPSWQFIRVPAQCDGCGRMIEPGESALYDWEAQNYPRCEHCGESPQRATMRISPATDAALARIKPDMPAAADADFAPSVNATAATCDNAGLVNQLEAFARRNARPGADVAATVDRMLAAVMRAVL